MQLLSPIAPGFLQKLANSFKRNFQAPAPADEMVPPAPTQSSASAPPAMQDNVRLMTECKEEDVFIVGYPKSGNTWFQELAAGTVYGLVPQYGPPTLVQDLVPDVHFRPHYRRYATPTFFKSHHLPRTEYRRVVYLLRDGRDAMVSYYHWFSARYGQELDFLDMVRNGTNLFPDGCKWHQHVEAWLANPFEAQMLILKYEDLKANTVRELERFCAFLGIERERQFLEFMAAEATFDKMRAREARLSKYSKMPPGKFFRRRGIVGGYRDEMPAAVLDAFRQEAAPTLRKTGYL